MIHSDQWLTISITADEQIVFETMRKFCAEVVPKLLAINQKAWCMEVEKTSLNAWKTKQTCSKMSSQAMKHGYLNITLKPGNKVFNKRASIIKAKKGKEKDQVENQEHVDCDLWCKRCCLLPLPTTQPSSQSACVKRDTAIFDQSSVNKKVRNVKKTKLGSFHLDNTLAHMALSNRQHWRKTTFHSWNNHCTYQISLCATFCFWN